MLDGYVAGYNRYLKDEAGKLPAACEDAPWVRPITVDDMYLVVAEKALHASGEVFAREIVDAARVRAADNHPSACQAGASTSISWRRGWKGYARAASAAMPWPSARTCPRTVTDSARQSALSLDQYRPLLPGPPDDARALRRDGRRSLAVCRRSSSVLTRRCLEPSVTFADHFTTFKLALDPGDATGTTYLVDGKPRKDDVEPVTVEPAARTAASASAARRFTSASRAP